jgi:hypothetical protein
VAATLGLLSVPLISSHASAATATFKQVNANEIKSGSDNKLAFKSANTAGNLIVVFLAWTNTSSVSVTDLQGNEYKKVGDQPTTWGSNRSSQVFYASNIAGGSNTVQAKFTTAIKSPGWADMYIHEYSGIDKANPVDVSNIGTGMSAAMSSGSATTTNANDLIFGAGASSGKVTQTGTDFTSRSTAFGNRTEDRNVTAVGPYEATATQDSNSNAWVMHVVAFKVDPSAPDTSAPSAPTGLTQTPKSTDQIELTWNGSTDDTGVTGYEVFRNDTQVAAPTTTLYTDTGLAPFTTYTYRVRARDQAGNVSAKSDAITATTASPPVDTTSPIVSITAPITDAIVSGTIDVTATASDDVGVVGVQFLLDGNPLGAQDTTPPYSISWNTSSTNDGDHVLTARARDAANNVASSAQVKVTVDKSPPDVTITGPTNTNVADMVNITANASDNVEVAAVQFQVDNVDRQTDTTRPYAMAWDSRTVANGPHTITARARDTAGNTKLSPSITINVANDYSQCNVTVGSGPTVSILEPNPARAVAAGEEVLLRAEGTDPNCGPLPDNAFDWKVAILDDARSVELISIPKVKNAAFTIPTQSSPEFRGFGVNARYHITVNVTNKQGQGATSSVDIYPKKVQLTFNTDPAGLELYIDGILRTTPYNLDTIVGSSVNVDARPQTSGGSSYTFASWSDGKTEKHDIVAPASATTYIATYALSPAAPVPIEFKQVNYSTSETSQRTVSVTYTSAQTARNTNILAIGWRSDQGTITSIKDEAGNRYVPAATLTPVEGKLSQAIYYATNIAGFRAGNTVQVTFSGDMIGVDARIAEYSGIADKDPVDAKSTNSGSNNSATASVTTTAANTVVFVAGISWSNFGTATPQEFITRVITQPKMGGLSGTGIVADSIVNSASNYTVTAPVTDSGAWLMQLVAFKGAAP